MSDQPNVSQTNHSSRREFLKTSGIAVAGGALAASLPFARNAHAAANDDTIKIALVGCGGRGSGAVKDSLTANPNTKLVAVADAFQDNIDSGLRRLKSQFPDRIDVPKEREFVGFDAYQKAIDAGCDLVILATPPGFRPIHFAAAVKAGKHVFTEKPVASDAPGIRAFLAANEEAKKKNLAVGVGLQRRHQKGYLETLKRFQDGAIGDFVTSRVYWNGGRPWWRKRSDLQAKYGKDLSEMEYQMRNWYYFTWLCGDHIVEQHIHNIDVSNWFKGKHPVKANGMGGSQVARNPDDGEIFDHHFVEFEYADGSRMFSQCRHQRGCWPSVTEHFHGTKGVAHLDAGANRYSIEVPGADPWRHNARGDGNPYEVEHVDLYAALRAGTPYNEGDFGATSTMTAILGRMATYSGKEITWDDALNSKISIMPAEYAWNATPPVVPGANGLYQQAVPGFTKVV